ncbi:MAG: YiiX/YebB-like N1pC/P60 family cysteine hydrolase [Paludisphaera borealis]|uniref:YiiX/YebB-like N1pC/P60 family cysteine hydrolase n=1 Tax=Paludisphaera borealis TaxID=1387353 RepID=UPI00284FEAA8|nr:YiiX/YebB-like N1pC/P60 family cysteine hydrolase [Paludisphaera borealis]MDR3622328.1 YiiX/YebB-like N1pC/P60 family cysteine hydrolase [Paludisphaera borealis]
MLHIVCWMIALATHEPGAAEATDWMKPPTWSGNYWGPEATHARSVGSLPPLQSNPEMGSWQRWGREVLRQGDIVFRLGDARVMRGLVPLSRFISHATGSPFSHTGVVAIEDGSPVVYDCSSAGVQRQPFEVWMLDSLGSLGVKRLKPEHRERIAGVIEYCRSAFERQVPFDNGFRMEDDSFYCLELTEKAFRSQGLALSEPVRIGDWEYLASFPVTAMLIPPVSGMMLGRPITLEQTVYLPGNERNGVWASPLLETVSGPTPKVFQEAAALEASRLNMRGDLDVLVFTFWEVRRSYTQLPARLLCDLVLQMRARGPLQAGVRERKRAGLDNEVASRSSSPASSLKRIEGSSD